jgi:uncharacterized protein YjiS (DUF1127 family)
MNRLYMSMLSREITMTTDLASVSVNPFVTMVTAPPPRKRLGDTILQWHRRIRARRELATLSVLELRDIGYPPELDAEKAKPFWRA